MPPLQLLRRLLRHQRHLFSQPHRLLHHQPHLRRPQTLLSPHFPPATTLSKFLSPPSLSFSTSVDTDTEDTAETAIAIAAEQPDKIARSLSAEILKQAASDSLPMTDRLHLHFSHITPTPSLVKSTLSLSLDAGREILGFHQWLSSNPNFTFSDQTTSYFIEFFGRRKDVKAIEDMLKSSVGVAGPISMEVAIDRIVRAGRPALALFFFEKMERDYGFKRNKESLRLVVGKLCDHGYGGHAEKMVKSLAHEFFPDNTICDLLIKGWCVREKLDQAQRLADEMYRGGFEIGVMSYNSMLYCVCKLCVKKDPFRITSEINKMLAEMDSRGIPRNVETFNVLITYLCKLRLTEDAMKWFSRMGEWGCQPNTRTYIVLIRSLYQAARLGEGDEMIDKMKSAGFGHALSMKAYYGFLKILCGIERIDHAMSLFEKIKKENLIPKMGTYNLLMKKLCSHGLVERANELFNEAKMKGLPMEPREYKLDPRFAKKLVVKKEQPKRETFAEKMEKKRKRLRKIRLSFVKKPKRMNRRS